MLFPSLSALSDAININLGVFLKRACPSCETRAVPLSHPSIKYLLNTLVPSMFYFSIKLGTSPKEEVLQIISFPNGCYLPNGYKWLREAVNICCVHQSA